MKQRQINLCGVPYLVTEIDGQVIFEEQSGFAGTFSRFTFEWKGCGWYLVDFEDWCGKIYAAHLVAAVQWIWEHYDVTYHDGIGTVSLCG